VFHVFFFEKAFLMVSKNSPHKMQSDIEIKNLANSSRNLSTYELTTLLFENPPLPNAMALFHMS